MLSCLKSIFKKNPKIYFTWGLSQRTPWSGIFSMADSMNSTDVLHEILWGIRTSLPWNSIEFDVQIPHGIPWALRNIFHVIPRDYFTRVRFWNRRIWINTLTHPTRNSELLAMMQSKALGKRWFQGNSQ